MAAALARFCIAPDHPSLPGHFPGQPVVPGAVLLDHALHYLEPRVSQKLTRQFSRVKFTAIVLPGQPLALHIDAQRSRSLDFSLRSENGTAMSASVRLAAVDS